MEIYAVSFNIRMDTESDGDFAFKYRKNGIVERIMEETPDVIGFQEVLPHVYKEMEEALPQYAFVGCGRETDLKGESAVIAYLKSRFTLCALETFWLSNTPKIPGSRFPLQSTCPRTAAMAVLHPENGTPIRIINTHLDHEFKEAREEGLKLIMKRICEEPLPAILTGDFNAAPNDPELTLLFQKASGLQDATAGITDTFHNYRREEPSKIDYIFTKDFQLKKSGIWESEAPFLSDHNPVWAKLDYTPTGKYGF